jgi:hypothetical protein
VHANRDDIPKGKSDMEPVAQEALRKFRAKVMTRMVKTYRSPADLESVGAHRQQGRRRRTITPERSGR